jgi:hypothetical protein
MFETDAAVTIFGAVPEDSAAGFGSEFASTLFCELIPKENSFRSWHLGTVLGNE